MIERLLHTFVPRTRDVDGTVTDPKVRSQVGNFASITCILCNTVLCIAKILAGLASGAVSIIADGVNNLADASSNIISLLGFKLASRPPDTEHPYGHGRYEYLAGLCVAVLILVVGVELLKESVGKIINPEPVEFSWVLVIVLVMSIAVKLWMMRFNLKLSVLINSTTLEATSVDSRNDCVSTGAVLIAVLISHFADIQLDAYMGAAVALFILWSGFQLVRDTISPLLGSPASPELVATIEERIMAHPEVIGVHDLIVHDYGPGRVFASVHAEVDASMPMLQSHTVIDDIESELREKDHLQVVIHMDPVVVDDPRTEEARRMVAHVLEGIDDRLTFHDLRMVPGDTHSNLIFDVVEPYDMGLTPDELRQRIIDDVHALRPDRHCVVTIDRSFVG